MLTLFFLLLFFSQELSSLSPGVYRCGGVVSSLGRGEPVREVGWLTCSPACHGRSACLSMCCPRDHWFDGASCKPTNNQSRLELEEENYNFEWSSYYSGYYTCDPERYKQVRSPRRQHHYQMSGRSSCSQTTSVTTPSRCLQSGPLYSSH